MFSFDVFSKKPLVPEQAHRAHPLELVSAINCRWNIWAVPQGANMRKHPDVHCSAHFIDRNLYWASTGNKISAQLGITGSSKFRLTFGPFGLFLPAGASRITDPSSSGVATN